MEHHLETCSANHSGTAGKMEVDSMFKTFKRSELKHGVKYSTYIGDGDTKNFKHLLDSKPYGDELIVEEKECVCYVEKRLGTRLRNVKKNNKEIGGKGVGKLTDKVIIELTRYFGLAIRRNPNSIEDMRNAIWATYFHKSSTDKNPQHHLCPPGTTSWCKYRVAEAKGELNAYKHGNPPLNDLVLKKIKPVYEGLTSDDLLERCLGANTQNSNESLNSLIWTFAPKHLHSGADPVIISTHLAVCIFNYGFSTILKVMSMMGITLGYYSHTYVDHRNNEHNRRSNTRSSDIAKEARTARREERSRQNEAGSEQEGQLYGPCIAD